MSDLTLKTPRKYPKFTPMLVLAFALIGAIILVTSHAATNDSLTLSPTSGTYDINTDFTVDINENSNTDQVGAVDIKLTYDSTKLQLTAIENTGGAFTNCFENNVATASLVCSKLGSGLTGPQKVGVATFHVLAGSGSTTVSFSSNSHLWSYAATPVELWNGVTTGGTYTLHTPDTTPPVVSITPPASPASGTVAIKGTASDDSGAVAKIEFYVNNVLKNTVNNPVNGATTTYNWDTTTIADGTYPVKVIAYDGATPTANQTPASGNVTVLNAKPDLVVSSVTVSPSIPKTGDVVTLSAVITNSGTLATVAGVSNTTSFVLDGATVSSPVDTLSLGIGGTRTITSTVNWTATLGNHTLAVTTDKNSTILESNEANNATSKSFAVYKPGDLNNSGTVDSNDLATFSFNYGKLSGMKYTDGDFNNDGKIDSSDVAILSFGWGK